MKKVILVLAILLSSCILKNTTPIATTNKDANIVKSGDIIIANGGNDSIILLDSEGNFKATLYSISTSATVSFPAMTWDAANNQLLFTYDSTTATLDAIMSVDPYDLTSTTVYNNSTVFTATGLNGLARLTGGDLVGIESTATMEKFDTSWSRVGAPFMNATLVATANDVSALSNGGFVVSSSSTTNTIGTYDSAGTAVASATSATPTPSLGAAVGATGVAVTPDDKIVAAFSGGTDGVRKFSADLATLEWNFINTNVLTTPGKIAVRSNGNVLVLDTAFNHIVEISSPGIFVRTLGAASISSPLGILVVP